MTQSAHRIFSLLQESCRRYLNIKYSFCPTCIIQHFVCFSLSSLHTPQNLLALLQSHNSVPSIWPTSIIDDVYGHGHVTIGPASVNLPLNPRCRQNPASLAVQKFQTPTSTVAGTVSPRPIPTTFDQLVRCQTMGTVNVWHGRERTQRKRIRRQSSRPNKSNSSVACPETMLDFAIECWNISADSTSLTDERKAALCCTTRPSLLESAQRCGIFNQRLAAMKISEFLTRQGQDMQDFGLVLNGPSTELGRCARAEDGYCP